MLFLIGRNGFLSFHANMTLNVMLMSVALFLTAKNSRKMWEASEKTRGRIKKLSDYSFGAYLMHILVIKLLDHNPLFKLNTLQFKPNIGDFEGVLLNPAISVPVIALITFLISLTISGLLHRIPVLKRYIV